MRPIRSPRLGDDYLLGFVTVDEPAKVENAVVWIILKVLLHEVEFMLQSGLDLRPSCRGVNLLRIGSVKHNMAACPDVFAMQGPGMVRCSTLHLTLRW